jgi:hypothetical protein
MPGVSQTNKMGNADTLRDLLSTGQSRGEALVQLRDGGVSPVRCVKALDEIQPLGVAEARELVRRLLSAPPGVPFWETPTETLSAVCRIPLDLNGHRNASAVQLLEASGYARWATDMSAGMIAEHIGQSSELLDSWLRYSYDNRGTPSWYLAPTGDENAPGTEWTVGWMSRSGSEPGQVFSDRVHATATFVKYTLDDLLRHSRAG